MYTHIALHCIVLHISHAKQTRITHITLHYSRIVTLEYNIIHHSHSIALPTHVDSLNTYKHTVIASH